MDRRKFLGGIAGNLLATPLVALAQQPPAPKPGAAVRKAGSPLAPNTARNLGPYASGETGGRNITDFSGITYDPVGKRMCLFGGGHGPSQETDIRILDLATMQWSSLYPTTKRSEMTAANGDSNYGRWISTNQPYARHSYNISVVAGRRFFLFTPFGQPDNLPSPPPYGGRACWYDFDAKTWSYSPMSGADTPWAPYSAAVLDPVSGKIVIAGLNKTNPGYIWLYDPESNTFVTGPSFPPAVGYAHDIVYFPPDDTFYVFQSDGRVWRMVVNRNNLSFSTVTALVVSGARPPASNRCGFAYDSVNKNIGGNASNGTFYCFDPATLAWTARQMQVEPGSVGVPDQVFHCLDFDPDSGCFVMLGDATSGATWLYRPASVAPGASTGVSDLSVTLDFGSGSLAVFAGSVATDQGDFVGEFVRQKCYVANNAAYPDWRVFFRVDADAAGKRLIGTGARDEVIVEYGRSTSGTPAHVLSPYTATISKSGSAVATLTIPRHWWYGRWRYQPSSRPVVRSPAMLKARGWIPNFGNAGLFALSPNTSAVEWNGPMSAPTGFNNSMGDGGDNNQIGFLTEFAADYAIFESPASLVSLRTEGEWCGNWPMHIRDEATGAVLDVRNNKLRYKADGGTINNSPDAATATNPSYVAIEAAHFYPCANLPWLLTDDPYYLEEVQFGCNWQLLFNQYHRNAQNLQGLVYPGQARSMAWGLRDLFLLAASCPANVPGWLRPKTYWRSCVEDNRIFAEGYQKSPARIHALFKTWPRSDADPAWQASWLNAVTGLAVSQGFSNWLPIFNWGVDKHIQQTNGTSGWPRQWPVPYYSIPNKAAVWGTSTGLFSTTAIDSTTCTSWADYWAYYKSGSPDAAGVGHTDTDGHTIDDHGWDGHTIMQNPSAPSFFLHLRAVLAVAVTRGVPGAVACYDYLQAELTNNVMPKYNARGQARFSVDAAAAPVSVPQGAMTNYQGIWWNAPSGSESGWGINLAHQGDVVFATWFTYDGSGRAWWLSLTANKVGENVYSGDFLATRGPPLDSVPFDPGQVIRVPSGAGTLAFDNADTGTLTYVVNGVSGTKRITRGVFAQPTPVCTYNAGEVPPPTENYQDLWWADPPESESGWGINVAHQGSTIFATWFTYDFDGSPMWLSFTADLIVEGVYAGELIRTTGPAFSSGPFDSRLVARQPVGEATLTFYHSNLALFEYTYAGISQSKRITRAVFQTTGTTCQ